MDLSKAFDTINHELMIAKLNAYGLDKNSLKTILSYLSGRWQRIKINTTFSSWSQLLQGVPQGRRSPGGPGGPWPPHFLQGKTFKN